MVGVAVSLFFGATASATAGTPPNRLDDNRGNALTIVGEAAVQALVSAICPLGLFCGVDIGARVESTPNVFDVYWDDSWDAHNPNSPTVAQIDNMVGTIAGGTYFDHANPQYGVSRGSFIGSHQATACGGTPSGSVDFLSLLGYITCEVQTPFTGVPYPDDNTVYALFLPEGATVTGALSANCPLTGGPAAFHAWSAALTIQFLKIDDIPTPIPHPVIQGYPFTVVPATCAIRQSGIPIHNVLDGMSELFSHELAEASIDPFPPTGWIDNSQPLSTLFTVGEPADICQPGSLSEVPTTPVRMANGFVVGTYWSNADNACVPFGASFHLGETGLPISISHEATVNGQTVTLPFDDNFEIGSSVGYSFPTPVADPNPGIRYVTGDPGFSGTISGPINDVASYTTQYFLTTGTAPGFLAGIDPALTPSGWHNSGDTVVLDTTDPINTGPGARYRFDHWGGTVFSFLLNPSVVMNAPQTATANYQLQFLLTVDTSGLGSNFTHIANGSTPLGIANDSSPLSVWIDSGTVLDLAPDADVDGAGGVQYFFQGFTPAPPATMTSPFTTTADYLTMAQLISQALGSGGIYGPSAAGLGNALTMKFAAVQTSMGTPDYTSALGQLKGFVALLQAQTGKEIVGSLSTTLQLDAMLVYHDALCKGVALGQVGPTMDANDYSFYSGLVSSLGGTVLPSC